MPPCHRVTDLRMCNAVTNTGLQQTVYVNNLWWAIQGDLDSHENQGALIAVYPPKNVYITGINVICAPGDQAAPDNIPICPHPAVCPELPWPKTGSPNTFVYSGAGGG